MKNILIGIVAVVAAVFLGWYFRDAFTPSITTLIVLADLFARRFPERAILHGVDRRAIFLFVGTVGIVLYAAVLGIIPIDVYRAGFSPFAVIALAVAAAALAPRAPRAAASALLVMVAFEVHLFGSRNLFDYAVDPLITAAVLLRAIGLLARRVRNRTVDRVSEQADASLLR